MLCDSIGLVFIHNLRDDEKHWAARCDACGHVQITPLPKVEEDELYYKENIVYRQITTKDKLDDIALMNKLKEWGLPQVETLERMIDPKSHILEIGSGYGWLVQLMREKGYNIDGIELNAQQRKMAKNRANIDLYECNISINLPSSMYESYDVVCMFHVLEHMNDPVRFLETASLALKTYGKILIEVPNFNCYIKHVSKSYDDFSYLRQHISYFMDSTLVRVLEKSAFKVEEVLCAQRYSIENALYWASYGKPHLPYYQLKVPAPLEFVDRYYKKALEKDMTADSIIALATKK